MAYPFVTPQDRWKIESNHQVSPKWKDKSSHLKHQRVLSKRDIEKQLSEPPEPEHERRS